MYSEKRRWSWWWELGLPEHGNYLFERSHHFRAAGRYEGGRSGLQEAEAAYTPSPFKGAGFTVSGPSAANLSLLVCGNRTHFFGGRAKGA